MSVTINGTVCRNCWDVDWARKAEREQIEKHQADTRKAQAAGTTPPDALKGVAKPVIPAGDPTTIAESSAPGQSINIFV